MVDLEKYLDKEILNMLPDDEIEQLRILYDPALWAEKRLGWKAREYQREYFDLLLDSKQFVLRWGRRLGKTDSMAISTLYYADTQFNADLEKGSYKVLVVCPFENQIDAFFDRLKVIVENSPELSDSVKFRHHKFEFLNGSVIEGKTAGSKSNKGAASLRGQGADLIIFDEVDYMNDKEINNVMRLKDEDPTRIRIIAASTPTGDRNLYYRWCTEAEELGWTHLHRTSLVSKHIHEINPENKNGLTYLEEIKQQLTQIDFLHEVMAEFGDNQKSLFQKRFIDAAINLGKEKNLTYDDGIVEPPLKSGPRILGVDWDRTSASTNMVILEFNKFDNTIYPIQRVEIPSHEFTYTEAVSKIIYLNERYDLDWIYVDKGYGETQIELLRQHGILHPDTGLLEKVIGIQFSQKVEIRDPHTKIKIKKDVKPFMVNNAVNVFEKQMIGLNPQDNKMKKQLEDYAIKNITSSGKPQYVSQEEHIVDCICLALLGFEQQFGKLFNVAMTARIVGISTKPFEDGIEIREAEALESPRVKSLIKSSLGTTLSTKSLYNQIHKQKSRSRVGRRSF